MNELTSLALETVADPIFLLAAAPEGRFAVIDLNRAAEVFFGIRREDYIGRALEDFLPPEARPTYLPRAREAADAGKPVVFEHAPHPGDDRVLETTYTPVLDAAGTCTHMLSISRDVTAQKRSEREVTALNETLRSRAEELQIVLDRVPVGIALADDPECRALQANRCLMKLLGLGGAVSGTLPAEAPRPYRFLAEGQEVEVCDLPLQRAAATGVESRELDLELLRADGSRLKVACWASPLLDPEGRPRGAVGVFKDETERRRQAELLRRQEVKLQEVRRLELLGRLAGGVAHDFNNLLTAINGYSELLLARAREDDPMRAYLEEIHRAGLRAAFLTRQLLAYGRKQVLLPRRQDLNEVLGEQEPMLRGVVGSGVEVVLALCPRPAEAMVDPGQIRQAILNLVVNARDAMDGRGRLTLATSVEDIYGQEAPASAPEGARGGLFAVLSVSDTGRGMSPEVKARAVEPFFSTKEMGEGPEGERTGTGLGLSMVEGIVTQSGGFLKVDSEEGRGTTVAIHLPVHDAALAARGGGPAM